MGEPEQDKEGQDCQDMTVAPRGLWKVCLVRGARTGLEQESGDRQPGQDNWDWTAYIGQLGQDSRDKTAGTGQIGQKSRDRRTGTGKSELTAGIVQPGYATEAEWPEHDRQDRIAQTGQPELNNRGS
jgi:hypothetical protein